MHSLIRELLQNPDPYHQIKEKFNRMMLELYFLLVTICDLIGELIGTRKGEFVIKKVRANV